MTTEEKNKIFNLLKHKAPNLKCPGCGAEKFIVAQDFTVFRLQGSPYDPASENQALMPSIAVVCSNCGYTSFFNLIKLGYMLPDTNEGKNKEDSEQ